jgi:hypothetical protein
VNPSAFPATRYVVNPVLLDVGLIIANPLILIAHIPKASPVATSVTLRCSFRFVPRTAGSDPRGSSTRKWRVVENACPPCSWLRSRSTREAQYSNSAQLLWLGDGRRVGGGAWNAAKSPNPKKPFPPLCPWKRSLASSSETSPKCLNHVELMPFQDIVLLRAVGLQFRRLISSSKRVSWIGGEECPC